MLQWVWDFFFGGGAADAFGGPLQLFEAPAMAR